MTQIDELNLDKELQKILEGLAYYLTSVAELSPFETLREDKEEVIKARQAITALIATQVQEARIDELQHIREFWGQAKDDTLSSKPFNFVALSDIDNRLAQLRSTPNDPR